MVSRFLTALILLLSLALAVTAAKGGDGTKPPSFCGGLSELVRALTHSAWGERHRFDLTFNGIPGRVYVNETTGTWTLFVLTGPERACLIAAGRGWKRAAPAGGEGSL